MANEARPGLTIGICAAAQCIGGGLGWSLVPALMPSIAKDLSLSHTLGGFVWGAAPLGIALAAPLGGAAVDRWGVRRVAGIAMFAGALACASRAFVTNGWMLAVAMFAFGLHVGFVAPAIPKALASHVNPKNLGRANGLALLGYTFGTALTVLIGRTWLAPLLGGWQNAMLFAGATMAAGAVAWLALVRDRSLPVKHASLTAVFGMAKDRQLLRVAAMQLCLFGGYLAMLGLLPRAFSERGMKPVEIGGAIAGWLAVAGVANLVGPWVSDRIGSRRPVLLAGSAIAGVSLALFALMPDAIVLLWIAAFGGGLVAPLLFVVPIELPTIGLARAGAALGLLMLVGQLGGFLLPILTGTAAQYGGFQAALGVLAVVHLALLLPAFTILETGKPAPRAESTGKGPTYVHATEPLA